MTILSKPSILCAAALVCVTACGGADDVRPASGAGEADTTEPRGGAGVRDVSALFDCVRETDTVLIAAHRGGPRPGYPENALETMQTTFAEDALVLEIDVSITADGKLFLFHDRTLGRLTGQGGTVAEMDWADIRSRRLIDNEGQRTEFSPSTLEDALDWAVEVGAILELDHKDPVSFGAIVSAVRAAGAEENVVLITYTDDQAQEVARLAPDLMMTASARSVGDLRNLERMGVDLDLLIAWTGTRNPSRPEFGDMEERGVEAAFGTLGRPGDRLDDHYRERDYRELVDMGVRLIATDRPGDVARFLDEDDRARAECLTYSGG